jgi:methylenetetrahydrofolate dehydrogenase (NADP+)/methenyltetrahydrofolate cyclohydrolase
MADGNLIDGRAIAEEVHGETAARVESLKARGVVPGLRSVRVGEDPASRVSEAELLQLIAELNVDDAIHGILVQAPLPQQINEARIFAAVSPAKDVDGFHPVNVGKLMLGDDTGFVPCTPAGVHQLLLRSNVELSGAEVVVLGRGNIVGKPMTALLCQKSAGANATVTLCHSRTRNVAAHCLRADIIVAAMGVPEFLKADMVKPGAVIMDVGVNRIPDPAAKNGSRLVGDVDFAMVQPVAGRITPNPGGVGPMTIAMLMQNTVRAAEMAHPA